MVENPEKRTKERSTLIFNQNVDSEFSRAGKSLEGLEKEVRTAGVRETQNDFRRVGKKYIESIKASLQASSANFNRVKHDTTLEDPYMKAYRYLEEKNVLALLEVCFIKFVFPGGVPVCVTSSQRSQAKLHCTITLNVSIKNHKMSSYFLQRNKNLLDRN